MLQDWIGHIGPAAQCRPALANSGGSQAREPHLLTGPNSFLCVTACVPLVLEEFVVAALQQDHSVRRTLPFCLP